MGITPGSEKFNNLIARLRAYAQNGPTANVGPLEISLNLIENVYSPTEPVEKQHFYRIGNIHRAFTVGSTHGQTDRMALVYEYNDATNLDWDPSWDATAQAEMEIHLLNAAELGLGPVYHIAIAVTPYMKMCVAAHQLAIVVWNLSTGTILNKYDIMSVKNGNNTVVIADNATTCMSMINDQLCTWDISTGNIIKKLPSKISDLIISSAPCRGFFAVNSDGLAEISLMDPQTINEVDEIDFPELDDIPRSNLVGYRRKLVSATALAIFENTGDIYIVASLQFVDIDASRSEASDEHTGSLCIWKMPVDESLAKCKYCIGHTDVVNSIAIAADNVTCVSASDDKTLRVWNLFTIPGTPIEAKHILIGHSGPVHSVVVAPDNIRCVSASEDTTVRIWNIHNGNPIHVFNGHYEAVTSVAMVGTSSRFVSGSKDGTLRVWNLPDIT